MSSLENLTSDGQLHFFHNEKVLDITFFMSRPFSLRIFLLTLGSTGSKQKNIFFVNEESLVTTIIDVEKIIGNIIYLTRSFSITSNLLPRSSSVLKFKFFVSRLY